VFAYEDGLLIHH